MRAVPIQLFADSHAHRAATELTRGGTAIDFPAMENEVFVR